MPRFKRKRWVSFVRKVNAAKATTAGLRSAGRNAIFSVEAVTNQQQVTFASLYSYNGGAGSGSVITGTDTNNDMAVILANEDTTFTSHKYMFQSAFLSISGTSVATTLAPAGTFAALIHIYALQTRDDLPPGVVFGQNPQTFFTDGYTTAGAITPGPAMNANNLVATPFNNSNFAQKYKVVLVKKIQLEAGESFTYEYRDPKNHIVNGTEVRDYGAKRGVTKYWFITVAGFPVAGASGNTRVQFVVRKNYNYYEMENNQSATTLL